MPFTKIASFSPDNKYFACFSTDDKLLIWETFNTNFIDCKYDSSVYSSCTSIHWVLQNQYVSPRKGKRHKNYSPNNHLLAVGTIKGDILFYDISTKNLNLHMVSCHFDAVNDMYFYGKTNSFFTCSSDKSVAIWDITKVKQILKWETDSPVSSIAVIDDNNVLSSSTSIIWWNISEKCIIKTFSGHSSEIFRLLPVNAVSLSSCYFLSAAVNDFKVAAWSLNSADCQIPVASFVLPDQPEDIDISDASSKDKPLILCAVTRDGCLHLFEHILNGNINQPVQPIASLEINSRSSLETSIMSVKLSPDSESCIVAYGSSKENMTFRDIKIKETLNDSKSQKTAPIKNRADYMFPEIKEKSKISKALAINGVKSTENSPKKPRMKEADCIISNSQKKLRYSSSVISGTESEISVSETKGTKSRKKKNCVTEIDLGDPKNAVDVLTKVLQAQNEDAINTIFENGDAEFIGASVKGLPRNSLKDILNVLSQRLHHKYSSATTSKWLKEIFRVHLNYLKQSQDTVESVTCIKKQIDSMKISETISKLFILKGFLNLQIQKSSNEESDSDSEKSMEL